MDPHMAVLEDIDEERRRLGLPISTAVRIGYGRGLAWAALSRHMDSRFREGLLTGPTLLDALIALREALRATEAV